MNLKTKSDNLEEYKLLINGRKNYKLKKITLLSLDGSMADNDQFI